MAEADESPAPDAIPGYPHPRETRALFGQGAAEAGFLAARRAGRLHHGWLLRGPAGIGKATLAYRIARAAIAGPGGTAPETLDPPPDCPVAARIRAGSEPRLAVLRRSVNPRTGRMRTQIAVEEVRDLRRFLGLSAPDAGWRAVIVDPADEMTTAAANALLKLLEEPPERTLLLLVSHAPGGLLATIRSRCRSLDLEPLGAADLAAALDQAGAPVAAGEATALTALAGGSVGRALRLVASDGVALYARIVGLMGPGGIDRAGLTALAETAAGREGAEQGALIGDLAVILLGRLARAAATGAAPPEAAPGEAALITRVAQDPARARLWAETAARVTATLGHARAVNLDPAQTIIDIFLELDATLGRAAEAG